MNRISTRGIVFVLSVLVGLTVFTVLPAEAKLPWVKKAKPFDAGVNGCISCHASAKPKKGEALNERGQWLVDEKKRRSVEETDLSWLKDYPRNGQELSQTPTK